MATIQFNALGKKDPINLNVRFFHNKINCYAKSNIFISSKDWDNDNQRIKKNVGLEVKQRISESIENMKNHIFNSFYRDFPSGESIGSNWLIKQVDEFYSKPSDEEDYRYYFVPFIKKYIEESKTRINPNSGQVIKDRTIQNYNTTLKRLEEFEKIEGKLRTKNINLNFHKRFTSFLKTNGNYSGTLIEKYISHIKNFVREAKIEGFETSIEIESKNFTFKRDETIDVYLNESEIKSIFNLNLKDNLRLDNTRDLMIAGLWTGLRVSDLKNINTFVITDNRIKIIETEKTGAFLEIPLHPQLKAVLKKRNNILPEISSQKFNSYMKEVCEKANIDEMNLGSIKDPKINRKVKGYYEKYKLVSSHTLRRSFATNLAGKLPDRTIMAITSHKSQSQFSKYIKTTQSQYADMLDEHWQAQSEEKNKINLKVV